MNKDRNDLQREAEEAFEWDSNPVKAAIQILFKGSLCETNYRKLSAQQINEAVETQFSEITGAKWARTKTRILNKVKKAQNPSDKILALGEYLLSE